MQLVRYSRWILAFSIFSAAISASVPLRAQTPSGALRAEVLDPSGARVASATVLVTSTAGAVAVATMNKEGVYEVRGLPPGKYKVQATAKGFGPFDQPDVEIAPGPATKLDITLQIEVQQEEVTVTGEAANVSVTPSNNVSAVVIKGKDLEALSDDPDELAADLQALAGPAAGPNGGQIYIDGFADGRLPPKSAIREIRVNQNPFSAQYDRLGYGRVEILTKPGTDKLHGQFTINGNQSTLNSRNPFVTHQPSYHSERYSGDLGGRLGVKASFFLSGERRNVTDSAIINAYILDANFNPTTFSAAVPNPRTHTSFTPRIDYQATPNNTLSVRYMLEKEGEKNSGIGLFSLPSQWSDQKSTEHTIQVTDSQVLGEKVVNEISFRYQRQTSDQVAQNFDPTVSVLSAFTGGGSSNGTAHSLHGHSTLQNYTSIAAGKHLVKVGGRLQVISQLTNSNSVFNGIFTFGSLSTYEITQKGLQQGWTAAQIRAAGGGADQFSIIAGNPRADVTRTDVGIYAEDDWRPRPNLSFSLGVRYETQNGISDYADFAPRVGFAWGLGRVGKTQPKTVVRAGFGIFYDRFGPDLMLQAERLNGINQQQYVVTDPDFFPIKPDPSTLTGTQTSPTVYRMDRNLRAPYMMQGAVSIERQMTKTITTSVTYLNSRGLHQFLTRNINAPLPTSGVRPYGDIGNIYNYESGGVFRQNQVIANMNVRMGARLSLFSNYTLSYANSNTAGASSFPVNQYDLRANYGRAAFDVRHRAFMGGSLGLPRAFRISPFIVAASGRPFNFTLGRDLNGDSIFNDRPALATDLGLDSVVPTIWGIFDAVPKAGQTLVPINNGTGPSLFTMNVRVSKTIGLGRKMDGGSARGGSGGGGRGRHGGGLGPGGLTGGGGFGGWGDTVTNRRYNITFTASARNIFNFVNLAPPVGNLNSPFFGTSNAIAGGPWSSSAANRRIDFQVTFNF